MLGHFIDANRLLCFGKVIYCFVTEYVVTV